MPSIAIEQLRKERLGEIVENVRFFMRDYAQLNRLTKGLDHNDRHIIWAIRDAVSDWRSTPPNIGQNLDMIIDQGWQSLFVRGVAIVLLESLRFLHMRNFLPYSDGGISTQTEQPELLSAVIQMMKSEYEQKRKAVLIAANIDRSLGGSGVHSEYILVNQFWGAI